MESFHLSWLHKYIKRMPTLVYTSASVHRARHLHQRLALLWLELTLFSGNFWPPNLLCGDFWPLSLSLGWWGRVLVTVPSLHFYLVAVPGDLCVSSNGVISNLGSLKWLCPAAASCSGVIERDTQVLPQLDSPFSALSPGDSVPHAPKVEGKALPMSMDCPSSRESCLLNHERNHSPWPDWHTALDLSKSRMKSHSLFDGFFCCQAP